MPAGETMTSGRLVQLSSVMTSTPTVMNATQFAAVVPAPSVQAGASFTLFVPPHLLAPRSFTRAESPYPIAPGPSLADTLIYEHATDSAKRYWLPRYRLRHSQGRYEIAIALEADGLWAIRFGLEAFPAPETAEPARGAEQLPHTLEASVRYRAPNSNIERRLTATELAADANGHVVTLRLTLDERDSLLRAFRSDAAQTEMVVKRCFDVAVQLPAEAPEEAPPPKVVVRDHRTQVGSRPNVVVRDHRTQVGSRPNVVVRDHRARSQADVGRRATMVNARIASDVTFRPAVEIVPPPVSDQPPPPSPVARFVKSPGALDSLVSLRFDPADHPYLFPSGSNAPAAPEFERIMLRHPVDDPAGRMHAYFRDLARPNTFYYLPDAVRLARTTEPPFVPALIFRVDQGDAAEGAEITMVCELRPSVDGKRLLAAATALKPHVKLQGGAVPPAPELQPLPARAKLRLALPRAGMAQTVDAAEEIDLANGCLLSERFALEDFQDVFAALTTSTLATLLRGNVVVSTGLAADDLVPVEIAIAEMAGEMFAYTETVDPVSGAVSAVLRNATESTLRIPSLPVWLKRGTQMVEGRIEASDPALPADLARDAQLTLRVNPASPLEGNEKTDAIFDTSALKALPDPETILSLTLDRSVAQESEREVTVVTRPELLAGDSPENEVLLVIVEFRGNVQVTLDAATLRVEKVKVPVPLIDVLLRKDTEGTYRFRQTVVYKLGGRTVKSEWRDDDSGVLVVPRA